MALSADDYFAPNGELVKAALWPRLDGEDESDRDSRAEDDVGAWITQAYALTSVDATTRLYVYGRAWRQFADTLNAIPASASNDEGSRQWLIQQIEYWSTKADEALEEFDGETVTDAGEYDTIQSYR